MKDRLLTIFTPTYNRAHTLPRLYQSLVKQTNPSFEWLVVDDGSSDHTEELVAEWIKEKKITIWYIKTANGGKPRAINVGASHTDRELFFIVDSDDYLTFDAVEKIHDVWQRIENKIFVGGIVMRRKILNSKILTKPYLRYEFQATTLEMTYKYGQKQDSAIILVTEKLKEFPFPEIEGEKYVPESYILNRLSNKYPMWCIDEFIWHSEYLPDGISLNINQRIKQNPKGFALAYKDNLRYKIVPLKDKLKYLIRIAQCFVYRILAKLK